MLRFIPQLNNSKITSKALKYIYNENGLSRNMLTQPGEREWSCHTTTAVPGHECSAAPGLIPNLLFISTPLK